MQRPTFSQKMPKKRKFYRTMDLHMKHSIGEISSMEYRRHLIFNEINSMAYDKYRTSMSSTFDFTDPDALSNDNDILGMEIHPVEKDWLLTITKHNTVAFYNVAQDDDIFENLYETLIPSDQQNIRKPPNSVHWNSDGLMFTTCSLYFVNFWNTHCFKVFKSIKMPRKVMNHVISTFNFCGSDQYVAVTGVEGQVYIIDTHSFEIVMTVANFDNVPTKAIQCHLTNDKQYITGNNEGNIYLTDLRFPKNYLLKFSNGNSFAKTSSDTHSIVGLQFYNYGNNVISVDNKGGIKTWDVNTGYMRPNHYESLPLNNLIYYLSFKEYQFSVTQNIKEDIAFMPTSKGLKIIDIEYGELLPHSNDTTIPLTCATYDKQNMYVYTAYKESVRYWSSQVKNNPL